MAKLFIVWLPACICRYCWITVTYLHSYGVYWQYNQSFEHSCCCRIQNRHHRAQNVSPVLPKSYTLPDFVTSLPFIFSHSQAAFRTDLSVLLDQVGTGKESLSFMKRRIRRLAQQWATAANRLDAKLEQQWRDQKKVSLFALIITAFSFNRSII